MKPRATMPIRIGPEIYPSAQAAAQATGVARCTIYWHASRGTLDRLWKSPEVGQAPPPLPRDTSEDVRALAAHLRRRASTPAEMEAAAMLLRLLARVEEAERTAA